MLSYRDDSRFAKRSGRLPRLEVVNLIDEALEFGAGVVALFGSHALVGSRRNVPGAVVGGARLERKLDNVAVTNR